MNLGRPRALRTKMLLFAALLPATTAPAPAQLIPISDEVTLHEPVDSCGHLFPVLAGVSDGATLAAWSFEDDQLVFRRIGPDGSLAVQQSRVLPTSGLFVNGIATTTGHDHAAVLASTFGGIFVQGLDAFGNQVTPTETIGTGANDPRIVRTPTGYAVAWDEYVSLTSERVHVAFLDASLRPTATFAREGEFSWSADAVAALDDGSVVLGTRAPDPISIQKVDASGMPVTDVIHLDDGRLLSLAAGHDQVAAAWLDARTFDTIRFQLLDSRSLEPRGPALDLGTFGASFLVAPKIRPTRDGWIVLWFGKNDSLLALPLSPAGRPLSGPTVLNQPIEDLFGADTALYTFDASYEDHHLTVVWQVFKKLYIWPIAKPCERSYNLRTRTFRVTGGTPTDIPTLGPMGKAAIICMLVGAGWILLRRSA